MTTNLVISVEKLNDYSICPRLFYYKHELSKIPVLKADYLEEGELIHEGLRLYYQSIIDGNRVGIGTIAEFMRNYSAKGLALKSEAIETTIDSLRMYIDYYGNAESWEIEAAEEPFAKILYEGNDVTVVVNGKTDLRVKRKDTRIIVDHKYEGQFREKRDRDNQPLAYCWAYDTRDFVYNRIGKQKSYGPEKRLARPYFCYTDNQIEEWKESAIMASLEILNYSRTKIWPMRYTGCNFHGNRCTFYDVCNTSPDNREYKLDNLFTNRISKSVMER